METKKCMWCLKKFESNNKNKYCSTACGVKSEGKSEDKFKKGVSAILGDFFGSLFS
jgi:hypothetical protein